MPPPAPVRTRPPRALRAPDPLDRALEPLLSEPFATAWAAQDTGDEAPASASAPTLRTRLLGRLAASRAESAPMFTTRMRRSTATPVAPGVTLRALYTSTAASAAQARPGEPLRTCLVELAPGARWEGPATAHHREWLVLRGQARVGGTSLRLRDYHAAPAGGPAAHVTTRTGALLFLRESWHDTQTDAATAPTTVRDAQAGWPEYAPGIRRRVLWQHGGQAALLYWADAGAAVPMHTHGHDEECLMVQGELFLDDQLLQPGDYQLAPAGTGHRITATDTGVVIYAHGDLDLRFTG